MPEATLSSRWGGSASFVECFSLKKEKRKKKEKTPKIKKKGKTFFFSFSLS